MSLLSKNQRAGSGISEQAAQIARQAVPAAKNAGTIAAQQTIPIAKTAGASVKQGADVAVAWAMPYIGAARHKAAPWLEQSAVTVRENIAPMISDALITAAHKIDYVEPKQRRLITKARVVAGSVVLTAAGAAAAVSLRNRRSNGNGITAGSPMASPAEPAASAGSMTDGYSSAEPTAPDAEANGYPPTT